MLLHGKYAANHFHIVKVGHRNGKVKRETLHIKKSKTSLDTVFIGLANGFEGICVSVRAAT